MCVYRTKDGLCKKHSTDEVTSYCVDGPCPDDVLTCDDLCGTGDCIVVQAATAITELIARAEAAEERAEKAERERDAAIERLRVDRWCDDCKHSPVAQACRNDGECSVCDSKCYCGGCENGSLWEWNGKEE